ncbi:MAG: PDZ domain-containing protein [Desulfonatronovibrio sp.]
MTFINQTILSRIRLVWPILAGLALAYMISGLAEYLSGSPIRPDLHPEAGPDKQVTQSWEGIIFEKNILHLEIPEHKPQQASPSSAADPGSWRLLAALTGTRDLALVSINNEVTLVQPGQSLEGWELLLIEPGSATWESGTRTRILKMWQEKDLPADSSSQPGSLLPDQSRSHKIALDREEVRPFLNDPNSLLQMAQFSPYDRDGERGFEISSIRSGSMLQKLGIRNRDVLTRIDGRPITGPTELLKAYSSLAQSSLVTMDILRQGENLSFVVEIN